MSGAYALIHPRASRPGWGRLQLTAQTAKLARLLAGIRSRRVRSVVLKGLGLTYLVAFATLRRQVLGLYGRRGILPVQVYLDQLRKLPALRRNRYWRVPTLFWAGASDRNLVSACQAGEAASALLLLGIAPRLMCLGLWGLYLSFVSVGQGFLSYQWDALLLEAGLDCVLVASEDPPWLARQVLKFLFFRLYFESGLCKLQSGDPAWKNGDACRFHYETQPLPTPLSWYFHQLPAPVQRFSTRATLALELGAPWLTYLPGRAGRVATLSLVGFQGLIAATGNYGFFNLLTSGLPFGSAGASKGWESVAALGLLSLSGLELLGRVEHTRPLARRLESLEWVGKLQAWSSPFYGVNSYGLFSVMTTKRPEIIVEGSDDGVSWKAYEFRYKAGDPRRAPRFVAPYQPRLDWQLWFAAMESPPQWFLAFVLRLLEGSPEVLALLGSNPFPERPPRLIRASYYDYHMTGRQERAETGAWWHRERLGLYLPPTRLRSSFLGREGRWSA